MRRILSGVLTVSLLLSLCVTMFSSCKVDSEKDETSNDEQLIEQRIEIFLTAYNKGDFEAVLECLDAKTQNTLEASLNLMGGFAGDISLYDLFGLSVGMISDGDILDVEISDITVLDEENATVIGSMKYNDKISSMSDNVYFSMLKENDDWFISNMAELEENYVQENITLAEERSIVITSYGEIFDGSITIVYEKDGVSFWGVSDCLGNIYYSEQGDWIKWKHMGNGAGYTYQTTKSGEKIYTIINSKGEIVATSSEMGFDEIIVANDGLAWVYKFKTGIDEGKHLYGIIDSEGNWVSPLIESDKAPASGFATSDKVLDEKIFAFNDYYGYNNHYTVFNGNTNKIIKINKASISGAHNGVIYGVGGYDGELEFDGKIKDLPYYYALYSDGSVEEIPEFVSISEGKIIRNVDDKIEIFDVDSKTTVLYDNYSASRIESVNFINGYGLVCISGADGQSYFTLIDSSGIQQFEPIVYNRNGGIKMSDGAIVYCSIYDGWSSEKCRYNIADINGNVLVDDEMEFTYINSFDNGIAIAKSDGLSFLINKNGEKVLL